MNFTCNSKPLNDALAVGIINSNISNFHKKSCIVQLTIEQGRLVINIESANIITEISVNGMAAEGDDFKTVFVDSVIFKQLISTLDSGTVNLSIEPSGLRITSGKSEFTLPKVVDGDGFALAVPANLPEGPGVDIDQESWKFIKDNQMHAISTSFIYPIYTKAWIGATGDVLVGDFNTSLFTHSSLGQLTSTCLLSDTIINLLVSMPETAKLHPVGKNFMITFTTDAFSYKTEFVPSYEDDEGVGNYNADMIMSVLEHPAASTLVECDKLRKILSQAELLAKLSDGKIVLSVEDGSLHLQDTHIDAQVPLIGDSEQYKLTFKLSALKSVINSYSDEKINIEPIIQNGEVSGIKVWDENLTTIIAGVE